MKASRAAFLAREAKEAGLNAHRSQILRDIEVAARNGETSISLDTPLTQDTEEWITELGYKVVQPINKYFLPPGAPMSQIAVVELILGNISW